MASDLNTIMVDGVTKNYEEYKASQTQKVTDNSSLNKDAFLQLLVTQLKYQDPLEPQDNSEFVAQLAQFSSLEQMSNIASGLGDVAKVVGNIDTSVLVGQLSSMIGQEVTWTKKISSENADGTTTQTSTDYEGKVTGVSITDGKPTIVAKSGEETYQISIDEIKSIGQKATATD
jgi:flagellar basal-body rod modification protein FlgD